MKRLIRLSAIGSLLAAVFFLAVMPVWAGGVDDKIKSLEDELAKLKTQQIEMKKEATAAADGLPTFSYRAGRGMTITAADKSWSFNTSFRLNVYIYNTIDGKPNFRQSSTQRSTGATAMELFPRRNRFYVTVCWVDCFYEYQYSIDGETAGDNGRQASVRDNEILFHFEQWNPFLPMFSIGLRRGAGMTHISRSSDSDGKVEHSQILDGFGWGGDGSHAGAGLHWEDVDIGSGEYSLFLNWASQRQGSHQEFRSDDRTGFLGYIGGKPFRKTKSKWIEGFEIGVGTQFHALDRPENLPDSAGVTGAGVAQEIRVRGAERRGRQDLFRPDATKIDACADLDGFEDGCGQNVGHGFAWVVIPGVRWRVGPYMFRAVWLKTQFEGKQDDMKGIQGTGWTIDHQLFIWSPKGLLTGSQTTPHSVMLSFGFERGDMECGLGCDAAPSTGSFHRNKILNREVALWYWVRPSFGLGMWAHFWHADNTPTRSQVALGCKKNFGAATAGKSASRSCDWETVNLGMRFRW